MNIEEEKNEFFDHGFLSLENGSDQKAAPRGKGRPKGEKNGKEKEKKVKGKVS